VYFAYIINYITAFLSLNICPSLHEGGAGKKRRMRKKKRKNNVKDRKSIFLVAYCKIIKTDRDISHTIQEDPLQNIATLFMFFRKILHILVIHCSIRKRHGESCKKHGFFRKKTTGNRSSFSLFGRQPKKENGRQSVFRLLYQKLVELFGCDLQNPQHIAA
jgi:hypothetical protein